MIPLTANTSSALWVARAVQSTQGSGSSSVVSSSGGTLLKEGLLLAPWLPSPSLWSWEMWYQPCLPVAHCLGRGVRRRQRCRRERCVRLWDMFLIFYSSALSSSAPFIVLAEVSSSFHLSWFMCPKRRREIVSPLRRRVSVGKSVDILATSTPVCGS